MYLYGVFGVFDEMLFVKMMLVVELLGIVDGVIELYKMIVVCCMLCEY